jgi:hypothetical protein
MKLKVIAATALVVLLLVTFAQNSDCLLNRIKEKITKSVPQWPLKVGRVTRELLLKFHDKFWPQRDMSQSADQQQRSFKQLTLMFLKCRTVYYLVKPRECLKFDGF